MFKLPKLYSLLLCLGVASFAASSIAVNQGAAVDAIPQAQDLDFITAAERTQRRINRHSNVKKAKNIVFVVGDGMSAATVTAARILAGQRIHGEGELAAANTLSFEKFDYTGLSKTYNVDRLVPDSASTMSAMMTGVKTRTGVISLNQNVRRGRCNSVTKSGTKNFLELAEARGKLTGIVTTARLTHATPAASFAHSPERSWEQDSAIPDKEKALGCIDLAQQFVEFKVGDGIDVAFAGGRGAFYPKTQADPEYPEIMGKRTDGINLIKQWQASNPRGQYLWNLQQFKQLDRHLPVLGLFEPSHMQFEVDRSKSSEPSLAEMTLRAIELLQAEEQGYFLIVEGGRIDHAHHRGNAHRALLETIELSRAVAAAQQVIDPAETLIVVTADHGHTLSLAGEAVPIDNPILGLAGFVDGHGVKSEQNHKDMLGLPYAVLNYVNGPGDGQLDQAPNIKTARQDISKENTQAVDYRQQANIPLPSETHSGEDVNIYAQGPSAQLFSGVIEQNDLFHLMYWAFK